jgi:hypothetical protein
VSLAADVDSPWGALVVEKTIRVVPTDAAVEVSYAIRPGEGTGESSLRFATELTLTLPESPDGPRGIALDAPPAPEGADLRLEGIGETPDLRGMRLLAAEHRFEIRIAPEPAARLWRHPVETVSQSEEGYESVFQGSNLCFSWPLSIGPGRSASFSVRLACRRTG